MRSYRYLPSLVLLLWICPLASAQDSSRYGPFNLLDRRSAYGTFWFPEPLRAHEGDVESEFRVDWLHTESRGRVGDEVEAELEKTFGLLTLEIELPYERETERGFDPDTLTTRRQRSEGIGPVEIAGRYPIYQWVSPDETIDFTLVPGLEVAIPTGSDISTDWEIVPQVFGLLRLGDHLALQGNVGYATVIGPEEGGRQTLEYSAVLAWVFAQDELPLPSFVQRVIPIVELLGKRGLNQEDRDHELTGTAGVRINLDAVGPLQPRLGLGYVFPISQGAADEFDWGVVSSFVLEF